MDLYPVTLLDEQAAVGSDRWNYLSDNIKPSYSEEEWARYKPLFDKTTEQIANGLERILTTYGDALRPRIKVQVLRTANGIRAERAGYLYLPTLLKEESGLDPDRFFQLRFNGSISPLASLSNMADEERKALEPKGSERGSAPLCLG
jgi:hypothetical protein